MKQLNNGDTHQVKGTYTIKVVVTSGTTTLEYQASTEGYDPIPDASFTETTTFNTEPLGAGSIQQTSTGDGVVYLSSVKGAV